MNSDSGVAHPPAPNHQGEGIVDTQSGEGHDGVTLQERSMVPVCGEPRTPDAPPW